MTFKEVLSKKTQLSEIILDKMYGDTWSDVDRKNKALKDVEWTIVYFVQSLSLNNKRILENYYSWLFVLFNRLGFDPKHLDLLFDEVSKTLSKHIGEQVEDFYKSITLDSKYVPEMLEKNNFEDEMKRFRDYVLEGKKNEALDYVKFLLENKISVENIYIYIFQESLRNIGQLWLEGKISVAMEHYYTAVTQYIMSSMYDTIFEPNDNKKKVLACAVGSELHEVGVRMVADVFELNGWNSRYLGANVPTKDIIDLATQFEPDLICLSVTMPHHILVLEDTIKRIKENDDTKDITIMVGGRALLNNKGVYKNVSADLYAEDAITGVKIANDYFM